MGPRRVVGAAAIAVALAGCQTTQTSGLDGQWASDDGVFLATFNEGRFSSRLNSTGEVVAEGSYLAGADGLQLTWLSIVTNETRTAVCRYVSARQLSCQPRGANPFTMTKLA